MPFIQTIIMVFTSCSANHFPPVAFQFIPSLKSYGRQSDSKYSTFGTKQPVTCLSIPDFRFLVSGREFHVITNNLHLTLAVASDAANCTPRELRYLQFLFGIPHWHAPHLGCCCNYRVHAISRAHVFSFSFVPSINHVNMAVKQTSNDELRQLCLSPKSQKEINLEHPNLKNCRHMPHDYLTYPAKNATAKRTNASLWYFNVIFRKHLLENNT